MEQQQYEDTRIERTWQELGDGYHNLVIRGVYDSPHGKKVAYALDSETHKSTKLIYSLFWKNDQKEIDAFIKRVSGEGEDIDLGENLIGRKVKAKVYTTKNGYMNVDHKSVELNEVIEPKVERKFSDDEIPF